MVRKQKEEEVTIVDAMLQGKEKKWQKHWLKHVKDIVNWQKFETRLKRVYSKSEGRPTYPPVVMLRYLLLSKWYNLSDRQLEEALEFRYDFCRFLGIKFESQIPDATTFSVFRSRIAKKWPMLMDLLNKQLREAGFKVKEAMGVDASLIEAHSKPQNSRDKEGDSDGSWRGFPSKEIINEKGKTQISRRSALFGYKLNISTTIKEGFISGLSVCKASEHETHHLKEFIDHDETLEVYADKGYVGNREYL